MEMETVLLALALVLGALAIGAALWERQRRPQRHDDTYVPRHRGVYNELLDENKSWDVK